MRHNDTGRHCEGELDLVHVIDTLHANVKPILATIGAMLAIVATYIVLAQPIYRTDLIVQVENSPEHAGGGLLANLSSIFEVNASADTEIELLRSRMMLADAVARARYDIEVRPMGFSWLGDTGTILVSRMDMPPTTDANEHSDFILTVLDKEHFELTGRTIQHPVQGMFAQLTEAHTTDGPLAIEVAPVRARPGSRFRMRKLPSVKVVADLQKSLRIVEKNKQSGVIAVSLESSDPLRASALLNVLGAVYVRQNGERRAAEAHKSLSFLDSQLPGLKQELRASEDALLAMRNAHGALNLGEEARLLLSQAVALQTRISLLRQERLAKLQHLTVAHPDIATIDGQMTAIKQELAQIQARGKILPDLEQALIRLTRDVHVNNELYVAMINGIQQLRLARAGTIANVRVVDVSIVPADPVKPQRLLLVAIAVLAGLLLGVCAAFVKAALRGGITGTNDVENIGMAVYTAIPVSNNQRRMDRRARFRRLGHRSHTDLLAAIHPQDPAVENLRSLRIALRLSMLERATRLVVLTGATQGVGKSFVAMNLAAVLAADGKRVLLIDGDLRRGGIDRHFGLSGTAGLAGVLAGATPWAQAIQESTLSGLDILGTGPKPEHPAQLLQNHALDTLLDETTQNYDLVLIDSAPVLPVADTLALARADALIIVVARHGVTSPEQLIEVRRRLESIGARADGVVLNAMRRSAAASSYEYASYVN